MTAQAAPTTEAKLRLTGVTLAYGQLRAVDTVDLVIAPGERHALIGPNGAGKSSLFSVIAGTVRPTAGRIEFDGLDVTGEGEASRARRGLVRTFQHSSLFLGCSVLDNVMVAVQRAHGTAFAPFSRRRHRAMALVARDHLAAVGLADRQDAVAAALSHGERRQLEVAMVLSAAPSLVLFDEPTAGMSPAETERFASLVDSLPDSITLVVVEHDLDVVFRLAQAVTVLQAGRVIASGEPGVIRRDPVVQRAYLGVDRPEDIFTGSPAGPGAE